MRRPPRANAPSEVRSQALRLETRDNTSVLICTDETGCDFPFATIEGGKLTIKSKHYSSQHKNYLTLAHVQMIAVEMRRQLRQPDVW